MISNIHAMVHLQFGDMLPLWICAYRFPGCCRTCVVQAPYRIQHNISISVPNCYLFIKKILYYRILGHSLSCDNGGQSIIYYAFVCQLTRCVVWLCRMKCQKVLGEGNFGVVYHAFFASPEGDQLEVAVKRLKGWVWQYVQNIMILLIL